jgi:hypothetical protein
MATIKTRYGYSELVSDPDDPWITRKLITELRTEQFDEHRYVVRGQRRALHGLL